MVWKTNAEVSQGSVTEDYENTYNIPWLWVNIGEAFTFVIRVHFKNLLFCWWSKLLDNLDQLRVSQLSLKERFAENEFSNDTSCWPNVYRSVVVAGAEHHLWGSVVARCDVRDGLLRLFTNLLGASEVAHFKDVAGGVNKEVLWLDVSVHDVVSVDVVEGAEELIGVQLDE